VKSAPTPEKALPAQRDNRKRTKETNQQPPPVQKPGRTKPPKTRKAWRKQPFTPGNKPMGEQKPPSP
jgi:hypothetical protein